MIHNHYDNDWVEQCKSVVHIYVSSFVRIAIHLIVMMVVLTKKDNMASMMNTYTEIKLAIDLNIVRDIQSLYYGNDKEIQASFFSLLSSCECEKLSDICFLLLSPNDSPQTI